VRYPDAHSGEASREPAPALLHLNLQGTSEEGYAGPAGRLAEPDATRIKGKRKGL